MSTSEDRARSLGEDSSESRKRVKDVNVVVVSTKEVVLGYLDKARALFRTCLPAPLDDRLYKRVRGGEARLAVALSSDPSKAVLAAALWGQAHPGECNYLYALAVTPTLRGEGIGSALLHLVLQEEGQKSEHKVELHVQTSNTDAIRVYERAGFVAKSEVKGFYRRLQCNDALLMRFETVKEH